MTSKDLEDKLVQAKKVLEQRKIEYFAQLGAVQTLETLIKEAVDARGDGGTIHDTKPESGSDSEHDDGA